MPDLFYIIDSHALVHRAYHAQMAPLAAPCGPCGMLRQRAPGCPRCNGTGYEPTKATYMVTKQILKLCRVRPPAFIALAYDAPRKTLLRRKLYPAYKGNRGPVQPEVNAQLRRVKEIAAAFGIPVLGAPGYEADDVIATLATASPPGTEVHIVGRDKDLMQLVRYGDAKGPGIGVYDPWETKLWGPNEVMLKYGVMPAQMRDWLALVGDPGDNVPGVRGIGEKGAAALLKEWGTGKAIYKAIKLIPMGQGVFLNNQRAEFKLSRQLTGLARNVPLDLAPGALCYNGLNMAAARPIFEDLNFKRWE